MRKNAGGILDRHPGEFGLQEPNRRDCLSLLPPSGSIRFNDSFGLALPKLFFDGREESVQRQMEIHCRYAFAFYFN